MKHQGTQIFPSVHLKLSFPGGVGICAQSVSGLQDGEQFPLVAQIQAMLAIWGTHIQVTRVILKARLVRDYPPPEPP